MKRRTGRRGAFGALGVAVVLAASVGVPGVAESQASPSSPTITTTSTALADETAMDAAAIEALLLETSGGPPPLGVGDPDYYANKALLEVFGTRFAGTWGPDRIQTVALTSLVAGDEALAMEALDAAADRVGGTDEVRMVQHRYSLVELNETRRLVQRVVQSLRPPPRGVGYGIDPIDNRVEVGIDPDDAERPELAQLRDYAADYPDRLVITLERLCAVSGSGSPTTTVPTTFPECGGAGGYVSPTVPSAPAPTTPIPASPAFTG